MSTRFPQLGITVDRDYVYTTTGFGKSNALGPLAGAHAELGEPTRHRRVGAAAASTAVMGAVIGPFALAPLLSKKSKSIAFAVTGDGNVHERTLDGNTAIRQAQSEVVRFNALAMRAGN